MDQPGVEVKPIKLISGKSPFCETFLVRLIFRVKWWIPDCISIWIRIPFLRILHGGPVRSLCHRLIWF
jgi:hypothetical protein